MSTNFQIRNTDVTILLYVSPVDPQKKVLGLFSESHIPFVLNREREGYNDGPSLPEMTRATIRILSQNTNGYFLMVEGGRIDHAAHLNRARDLFEETLEFDNAINAATEMVSGDETLILVTADHETGGVTLSGRCDSLRLG